MVHSEKDNGAAVDTGADSANDVDVDADTGKIQVSLLALICILMSILDGTIVLILTLLLISLAVTT